MIIHIHIYMISVLHVLYYILFFAISFYLRYIPIIPTSSFHSLLLSSAAVSFIALTR